MREIVLDTETTGFKPQDGHKLVEIGAVELVNLVPTGREFHVYVNPERDVPQGAYDVHGLDQDFLSKHPTFPHHAEAFLSFVQESPLIIHNAPFDMGFLNFQLQEIGQRALKNPVVDTLKMARKMFPGSPASLDALVKRFQIEHQDRTKHGALLDSQILAEVYLHLKGGRQPTFLSGGDKKEDTARDEDLLRKRLYHEPRTFSVTPEELNHHKELVVELSKKSKVLPVWEQFD